MKDTSQHIQNLQQVFFFTQMFLDLFIEVFQAFLNLKQMCSMLTTLASCQFNSVHSH